jgi:triacylglycerol lipase
MKDALNLGSWEALLTLLPYDDRINKIGKLFNLRPEPYIFFLDHESIPFDTVSRRFTAEKAWWLSELAFLAYEKGRVVELLLKNLGFEGKFFDSVLWDGEAFIAYDDARVFLVYRGTEPTNLRDWLTDLRANKITTGKKGTVHSGFKEHFDELEKDFRIGSMLSILLNGDRKLYIAGHSLGGALAVYAAHYYMNHVPVVRRDELSVYTFGAPKIGDLDFTESFSDLPAFRLVHRNDIIPRLPPLGNFHPAGQLVYLDEQGISRTDRLPALPGLDNERTAGSAWSSVLSSVLAFRPSKWKQYASIFLDHSPVYYSVVLKLHLAHLQKEKARAVADSSLAIP